MERSTKRRRLVAAAVCPSEPRVTRSLTKRLRVIEANYYVTTTHVSATMGPMTLHSMPIDCLYVIFQKIPLAKLISLRTVCRYWKEIIEAVFRWVRTLKIRIYTHPSGLCQCPNFVPCSLKTLIWTDSLVGYLDKKEHRSGPDRTVLTIEEGNATAAVRDQLRVLFPNVDNIQLCSLMEFRPGKFGKLLVLLTAFPNATRAAIWAMQMSHSYSRPEVGTIKRLCSTINKKLYGLTVFDLNVEDLHNWRLPTTPTPHSAIELNNILPSLKQFNLGCSVVNHFDILRGLTGNLTTLTINCHYLQADTLRTFLEEKKGDISVSVTHLRLLYVPNDAVVLELLRFFTAIQSLQLVYSEYQRGIFGNELHQQISSMPCLSTLRLHDYILDGTMIRSNNHIRTLALATFDLIPRFGHHYCTNGIFDVPLFCRSLLTQFPHLETLVILLYLDEENTGTAPARMESIMMDVFAKLYHVKPLELPISLLLDFQMIEFTSLNEKYPTHIRFI